MMEDECLNNVLVRWLPVLPKLDIRPHNSLLINDVTHRRELSTTSGLGDIIVTLLWQYTNFTYAGQSIQREWKLAKFRYWLTLVISDSPDILKFYDSS